MAVVMLLMLLATVRSSPARTTDAAGEAASLVPNSQPEHPARCRGPPVKAVM
jgi:hypothetical protein